MVPYLCVTKSLMPAQLRECEYEKHSNLKLKIHVHVIKMMLMMTIVCILIVNNKYTYLLNLEDISHIS